MRRVLPPATLTCMQITEVTDDGPDDDTPPPFDNGANTDGAVINCQTCGLPIEKRPGHRRGKWHPECKPSGAQQRSTGSRATNIDTLIDGIEQLHIAMSAGLSFVPPLQADGMVVAVNARSMAESWRALIIRDANIRKFWEKATTGTGWGKVIIAYGMVGMAIAANHGVTLPGMKVGHP